MQIFHSLQDYECITVLKNGAVGVVPTDTIYGIVTKAALPESVARLYAAKSREHKPGTLIAADIAQLVDLGIDETVLQPLAKYWPGPISIVLPTGDNLAYLRQGVPGLACRIPNSERIRDLLFQTGPLLTSSANQPGNPPATDVREAQAYFGDNVDFYVDGGTIVNHQPSTVIRIEPDQSVTILRQGAAVIPKVTKEA